LRDASRDALSDGAAQRYLELRAAIDDELRRCGRERDGVTLVGISKGQPAHAVTEAIEAGLTDVGESYLQEAQRKLSALPPVRKHFVGHIQTNKAKAIVASFDMVQAVDRLEAAMALSRAATELGKVLPILLQLNVTSQPRYGCDPAGAPALAQALRELRGLRLDGVMALGPLTEDRAAIADAFELAAKTLRRIGGSTLSIGMSGDWREALRAGSTMLRIGEGLFGPRTYGRHT
jgi:pyridoxal phosphate enzyme (YggS family)